MLACGHRIPIIMGPRGVNIFGKSFLLKVVCLEMTFKNV